MQTRAYIFLSSALSALLSSAGSSQTVRGVVLTATDHLPSVETSVVLVNDKGDVVRSSLTSSTGAYELKVPHSGSYRVRARRVGFLPDSSSLLGIDATSAIVFNPVLRSFSLERVSVVAPRRCVMASEAGAVAFRLWQEVQSALSATLATTESGKVGFVLQRFTREIDPTTGRVVAARSWQTSSAASESFKSVVPDSLAARSFRRTEKDSSLYFAPDAQTLTSESFASGHCLRPVEDPSRPSMIGLGFEPSKPHDGDVRGVMWLDRTSVALRSIDYTYVDSHQTDTALLATGRVRYNRLPNGGWFVSSWLIRVPVKTTILKTAPEFAGQARLGSATRHTLADVVTHMWEVGGNVSGLLDESQDTQYQASQLGRVQGTIVTEGAGRGIAGIDVVLRKTLDSSVVTRTLTGSDGGFAFDSVTAGAYTVSVQDPRLDTLNTPVLPTAVTAWASAATTITITVPTPDTGLRALCSIGMSPGKAALHGLVADSASNPIKGARVHLSWLTGISRTLLGAQHERATYTDANGRYAFCDLDPTSRLTVDASIGGNRTRPHPSITLNAGELRMYDVTLPVPK